MDISKLEVGQTQKTPSSWLLYWALLSLGDGLWHRSAPSGGWTWCLEAISWCHLSWKSPVWRLWSPAVWLYRGSWGQFSSLGVALLLPVACFLPLCPDPWNSNCTHSFAVISSNEVLFKKQLNYDIRFGYNLLFYIYERGIDLFRHNVIMH